MRLAYRLLLTALPALLLLPLLAGCSGDAVLKLNDYVFAYNSDNLTNLYFPGRAGRVLEYTGASGDYLGQSYSWVFSEGPDVRGVHTVKEVGLYGPSGGTMTQIFASLLAQDVQGNVHVLANEVNGEWVYSGVAANQEKTILMVTDPAAGDSFNPNPAVYASGTVVAVNQVQGSYTGVLHTRLTTLAGDVYDDYWAPGVGQIYSEWNETGGQSGTWVRSSS